jgi:proton-dependent oligopeptide transporter, POT family
MSAPSSSAAPASGAPQPDGYLGHPRGLLTLFSTEMWERFSYYGMRAILLLFMVKPVAEGGLGFSDSKAGIIFGTYTAMAYLMSLPGGWIADRFLGQRKAVFYGGLLIMSGHICMAIPIMATFYTGLALIVIGTGLLKPNISTIVGQLYRQGDPRRDAGFSIFYMGINTGAFLAPLVCGTLAQAAWFGDLLEDVGIHRHAGWHFGFGAAAVGMFFGVLQYVATGKNLGDAGLRPVPAASPAEAAKHRQMLYGVLAVVFGIPIVVGLLAFAGTITVTPEGLGNVFGILLALLPIVLFVCLFIFGTWTSAEKRQLVVIIVLFFGAAVFWSCFEQAASTLTLFADRHTRCEIFGWSFPPSYYQSVNSLLIITALGPLFAWLWLFLARRKREPSSTAKFAIAMVLVGAGFAVMLPAAGIVQGGTQAGPHWLFLLYFLHTAAEMCLSPVGLSSMTKLAPARIAGMTMGIWFLAASLGNLIAGRAAGLTEHMTIGEVFLLFTIFPVAIGLVLFALVRPIRRMLQRSEGGDSDSTPGAEPKIPPARVVGS